MYHAFTIDVECWYHPLRFYRDTSDIVDSRFEVGFNRLVGLLSEFDVKATFFWVADVARAYPYLARLVASQGHEIGCHSFTHNRMAYQQTPAEFLIETRRAISLLEDVTGQAVRGYRAPCFSITERSLWALDILAELGIDYDSSIFPVHNWRYGIPGFPLHPIPIGSGQRVWEFPISVRRLGRVNMPASGGAYFRIYPYWLTANNFRAAEAAGHGVVFYVHNWELDPNHPRVPFYWKAWATHYFNLRYTFPRLQRLLSEFRFMPLGKLCDIYKREHDKQSAGAQ